MNRALIAAIAVLAAALGAAECVHADTLLVPEEYGTIQAAIDAAIGGDEVVVADGVYTGPGNRDMDFGGKAITVRSQNGTAACIIDIQADAGDPHRAIDFRSGETAESMLVGFTVRNGFMDSGGAMLIENDSSPTITDCSFEDNTANPTIEFTGGGAVAIYGSQPTFVDCVFTGNQVNAIDEFTGGGAVYAESGGAVFTGCDFTGNDLVGKFGDGGGGAIRNDGASLTFADCTFTGNTSTFGGGAIFSNLNGQMDLSACVFEDNSAVAGGGGVAMGDAGTHATFTDCQISGSTSGSNFGGGGVRIVSDATADFIDCAFLNNISSPGIGGGAHITTGAKVTFTRTVFSGNHAGGGGGGGLNAGGPQNGPQVTAINCQFYDNTTDGGGGAIRAGIDSLLQIVNCTFSDNAAGTEGGALRVQDSAIVVVDNSILWGNAPDEVDVFDATLEMNYSNIAEFWGGPGNIEADPMFVDPGNGDYRLSAGSPCIDAADNFAVPKGGLKGDLDGNPRFVDDPKTKDTGNGEAPIVDMGAYEFQVVSCDWDLDGDDNVGTTDLLLLLGAWGDPYGTADLVELLGNWGPCP